MRRAIFALILVFVLAGSAQAQTGGQLWVRAYEDRNGNGSKEANEPYLSKGIGVDLLNGDSVVIASALLDNSPNAAQGLVGFQQLPAGEYTVAITGPEFKATTADRVTMSVSDTGVPAVVEFGAQRLSLSPTPAASTGLALPFALPQDQRVQIAVAAVSAALVVGFMIVVGFVFYLIVYRGRMAKAKAADARATGTTGQMRPVRTTGTGQYPRATK